MHSTAHRVWPILQIPACLWLKITVFVLSSHTITIWTWYCTWPCHITVAVVCLFACGIHMIRTPKPGFMICNGQGGIAVDKDQCRLCWFNYVTMSSVWNKRWLWWEMWGRPPFGSGTAGKRRKWQTRGHALAGKTKLNPVSLNASEMMRLLHFCAELFILSPCMPFIYNVEAFTFPQCKEDCSQVGELLEQPLWNLQQTTLSGNEHIFFMLLQCCRLP